MTFLRTVVVVLMNQDRVGLGQTALSLFALTVSVSCLSASRPWLLCVSPGHIVEVSPTHMPVRLARGYEGKHLGDTQRDIQRDTQGNTQRDTQRDTQRGAQRDTQ